MTSNPKSENLQAQSYAPKWVEATMAPHHSKYQPEKILEIIEVVRKTGFIVSEKLNSKSNSHYEYWMNILDSSIATAFFRRAFYSTSDTQLKLVHDEAARIRYFCQEITRSLSSPVGANMRSYLNLMSSFSSGTEIQYEKALEEIIAAAEWVLARGVKSRKLTGPHWGDTPRETFLISLEHTFRSHIASDPSWAPQLYSNKKRGSDEFSSFVSAVTKLEGSLCPSNPLLEPISLC